MNKEEQEKFLGIMKEAILADSESDSWLIYEAARKEYEDRHANKDLHQGV